MPQRVQHEPAYILHRYDWSESSVILEVFSRQHGRLALVAKGAKRPSSNFRPVLLPLQPLRLSWGGDAEIRTLKSAEWVGGQVMPQGEALLSGWYLNELLMRLLARDDPHERLFDAYAEVVTWLARDSAGEAREAALRAFELIVLREVGVLPALDAETSSLQPLTATRAYRLVPEAGLIAAEAMAEPDRAGASIAGRDWQALDRALSGPAPLADAARAGAPVNAALKPMLRALLHYHCGVPVLKTRQLFMDIRSL